MTIEPDNQTDNLFKSPENQWGYPLFDENKHIGSFILLI